MSNETSADDRNTLSNPGWRDLLFRQVQDAARRASGNPPLPVVNSTFGRLMSQVPHGNGYEALVALRRALRVMEAFSRLREVDWEVLAGRLPDHRHFQFER